MTCDVVVMLNLYEVRLLFRAPFVGVGTPSVEPAPWWWVDRTGNLSTDYVLRPL